MRTFFNVKVNFPLCLLDCTLGMLWYFFIRPIFLTNRFSCCPDNIAVLSNIRPCMAYIGMSVCTACTYCVGEISIDTDVEGISMTYRWLGNTADSPCRDRKLSAGR